MVVPLPSWLTALTPLLPLEISEDNVSVSPWLKLIVPLPLPNVIVGLTSVMLLSLPPGVPTFNVPTEPPEAAITTPNPALAPPPRAIVRAPPPACPITREAVLFQPAPSPETSTESLEDIAD